MPTNVSISGETGVSVSVGGSTAASVSVTPGGTGVSVSASGGIGPTGWLTPAGTSANLYGVLQLVAGKGVTISTTSGQFTIASYDVTAVSGYAPVQSVAGRTGNVVLQAADITSGTFATGRIPTISYTALSDVPQAFPPSSHTHSTTDVVSFTAAAAASAPVQSVQGKTGAITLSRLDLTAAASVHTHSTADIVGITSGFVQSGHTHDAADITSGVFSVARIPTIGYTALSGVPAAFTAASHTHDASEIAAGTISLARLPTIGYTALSGVPTAFTAASHTHDASAIAAGTISLDRLPTHVHSVNGLTGTLSIVAGSNVTVSTAVGNVILAAAQGPQGPAGSFGDPQTIQPKTTSYTLRLTDVGTLLTFAGGTSAITVTVPDQSSVAWAAGSHIDVARLDSSPVTFYGSGNSYIYATPSPSLRDLGSGASLVYLGSDKWLLVGDLA